MVQLQKLKLVVQDVTEEREGMMFFVRMRYLQRLERASFEDLGVFICINIEAERFVQLNVRNSFFLCFTAENLSEP